MALNLKGGQKGGNKGVGKARRGYKKQNERKAKKYKTFLRHSTYKQIAAALSK